LCGFVFVLYNKLIDQSNDRYSFWERFRLWSDWKQKCPVRILIRIIERRFEQHYPLLFLTCECVMCLCTSLLTAQYHVAHGSIHTIYLVSISHSFLFFSTVVYFWWIWQW
jgi:hypothetical protein